jgi:hypothetical protein
MTEGNPEALAGRESVPDDLQKLIAELEARTEDLKDDKNFEAALKATLEGLALRRAKQPDYSDMGGE